MRELLIELGTKEEFYLIKRAVLIQEITRMKKTYKKLKINEQISRN